MGVTVKEIRTGRQGKCWSRLVMLNCGSGDYVGLHKVLWVWGGHADLQKSCESERWVQEDGTGVPGVGALASTSTMQTDTSE